jgi:hypothetical protein
MLLSPADSGPAPRKGPGRDRETDSWLTAPLAEPTAAFGMRAGGAAQASHLIDDGAGAVSLAEAGLRQGGCFTRALPLDASCASAARSFFREAVAGTGLPADLVHDGLTMASELAANTLNAHGNVEFAGGARRPVNGMPEFWLYVRDCGHAREIVCKVFDSDPGWTCAEPGTELIVTDPVDPDSVSGRGLQVVAGLSAGSWGHHPTRSRLGAWKVPGKAVWFTLRVPPGNELGRYPGPELRPWQAAEELAGLLSARGLRGLVRSATPSGDMAVLSVRHRLTVWCRGSAVWWRQPDGADVRFAATDLIEASEQIVCQNELLDAATGP